MKKKKKPLKVNQTKIIVDKYYLASAQDAARVVNDPSIIKNIRYSGKESRIYPYGRRFKSQVIKSEGTKTRFIFMEDRKIEN